jgi:hypothetical protein
MLAPLGVVVSLFRSADIARYAEYGAVSVPFSSLPSSTFRDFSFIQGSVSKPIAFSRDVTTTWVQFKIVELALDFWTVMERYQLNHIPKEGLTEAAWCDVIRKYIDEWLACIYAEKRRQYTLEDAGAWPVKLPWRVMDIADMPVVIWVYKLP